MYPGQTWASFPIPVIDDALTEPDETYTLTATITSANVVNPLISLPVTVIDNDTLPTVTMENWMTIEGDAVYATPVLDRVYNSDVVVHLVTTSGTAGSDDYNTVTANVTPGAKLYWSGSIATTDDTLDEPRENFTVDGTVTSSNTVNATFSATMTIKDNDGLPDFELDGPSIEEGSPADFMSHLPSKSC